MAGRAARAKRHEWPRNQQGSTAVAVGIRSSSLGESIKTYRRETSAWMQTNFGT